ncbi:hypothetical protein T484DRAFT_1753939 [Baffinella frigidus]|nr:hypothetical protein T484DRAFT_1753939 [Cryptophyta sp. CCMP2293]
MAYGIATFYDVITTPVPLKIEPEPIEPEPIEVWVSISHVIAVDIAVIIARTLWNICSMYSSKCYSSKCNESGSENQDNSDDPELENQDNGAPYKLCMFRLTYEFWTVTTTDAFMASGTGFSTEEISVEFIKKFVVKFVVNGVPRTVRRSDQWRHIKEGDDWSIVKPSELELAGLKDNKTGQVFLFEDVLFCCQEVIVV